MHVQNNPIYRGTTFLEIPIQSLQSSEPSCLVSPEITLPFPANQVILSWNVQMPNEDGVSISLRAFCKDHWTPYYTVAIWSLDNPSLRHSVAGQETEDGTFETDTLILRYPAHCVQVRLLYMGNQQPTWKFLGLCATSTSQITLSSLPAYSDAWGRELSVPQRTQLGWDGASGWCSPTSTSMVLAYWAEKLLRPELLRTVPEVAKAVFDSTWQGTGNWPFNTAYAGSFEHIRAYVTRFSDVCELEEWILAGVPPIVSLSYDLLKGNPIANDPGHLMVCTGFTSKGDPIFNDPYYWPHEGEPCRKTFPRDNFAKAWSHSLKTVYLIYPEEFPIPPDKFHHWT